MKLRGVVAAVCLALVGCSRNSVSYGEHIRCFSGGVVVYEARGVYTTNDGPGFRVWSQDGHLDWITGTCVVENYKAGRPAEKR